MAVDDVIFSDDERKKVCTFTRVSDEGNVCVYVCLVKGEYSILIYRVNSHRKGKGNKVSVCFGFVLLFFKYWIFTLSNELMPDMVFFSFISLILFLSYNIEGEVNDACWLPSRNLPWE